MLLAGVDYAPAQIELTLTQGRLHESLGAYTDAEAAYSLALQHAASNADLESMQDAAAHLLRVVGHALRRPDDALRRYRLLATVPRPDEFGAQVRGANSLGAALSAKGEYALAEAEYRRALELRRTSVGPDDSVDDLMVYALTNNVGVALLSQGEYADAEIELRRAVAGREAALGLRHPEVAQSRSNLGNALFKQGK